MPVPSFILANTEQLHSKIGVMSDRIRTLEEAVQALQLSSSSDPHPLLSSDLLAIKSTLALYSDTQTGSAHEVTHMSSRHESRQRDPRDPSPQHSAEAVQIDSNSGNSREVRAPSLSAYQSLLDTPVFVSRTLRQRETRMTTRSFV
jgi:hypothetical protein